MTFSWQGDEASSLLGMSQAGTEADVLLLMAPRFKCGIFLFPCLRMLINFKSRLIPAAWQRPHQRYGQERRDNTVHLDHNRVGVRINEVELRGNVDRLLFILPN